MKGRRLFNEVLTSVMALVLALVLAGIVVAVAGRSPVLAVEALFRGAFGTPDNLADTINRTTPLILTGLAVSFAFRAGLFNIGGEGQYLVGGLGCVWAGLTFKTMNPWALVPLTLICGMLAGGVWGGLSAWLKSRFGVHEVISTIMLNWCALYLVSFWVNSPTSPLKDPSGEGTYRVPYTAVVPSYIGTSIYSGIAIALVVAAIIWFVLRRTWLGYEIGAAGLSPLAAEYGGISVPRAMIVAMAASGAMAALAGAMDYSIQGRIPSTVSFLGKGFDGIAVALIGKNEPVGVVIAALIFGALSAGNTELQVAANVPKDVTTIVQGLIIIFMVAPDVIRQLLPFLKVKEA